jgi:hypothetical protein
MGESIRLQRTHYRQWVLIAVGASGAIDYKIWQFATGFSDVYQN